jgi:hypothetical protein
MDENPQTTIRTPNDFRVHIMEPDYAAFERAPTDLRIAFHAAASLFHLRDWIAFAQCVSPAQLQSELENRCDLFGVIRDVANASKHLRLKRHSTSVLDAGDIRVQEIGVTGYGVGPGGYGQAVLTGRYQQSSLYLRASCLRTPPGRSARCGHNFLKNVAGR